MSALLIGLVSICVLVDPDPYMAFGNRYYIRKMNLDGTNYTALPGSYPFIHVLATNYKVCNTNGFSLRLFERVPRHFPDPLHLYLADAIVRA